MDMDEKIIKQVRFGQKTFCTKTKLDLRFEKSIGNWNKRIKNLKQ